MVPERASRPICFECGVCELAATFYKSSKARDKERHANYNNANVTQTAVGYTQNEDVIMKISS